MPHPAEAVLVADTARVELVLSRVDVNRYRAAAHDGACEFERVAHGWAIATVEGRDPLADQATDRFVGLDVEHAALFPDAATNAYPEPYERLAHIFDHPSAPDLVVVRTAAFHVHGNMGEHGSLAAVQSRAAFAAGGAGIASDGLVDRHLLAVDVAPTIAAALGCKADDSGRHLGTQDGSADHRLLSAEPASHVIAFLFDGLNANLLVDAIGAGDVPNIAAVMEPGTVYRHGSLASLPTVTLPNHTTLLTGLHPGHHGILNNQWLDRATGATPNLLDVPQMVRASDHLLPGVETLFEAIARHHPDSFNAATYEYADRGAHWSTYAEVRAGGRPTGVPRRTDPVPDATESWCASNEIYHFMSRIDTASTAQAIALLDESTETPPPTFLWVNYSLTDEAGHHAGPHGDEARDALRDTDARMGRVLDAARTAGTYDDTAVFVLADHGMEQTDPGVTGHYRDHLDAAGFSYRDVDDGFLYLD